MCSAPILQYPQLDQPFTLQTDASDAGLGAVLTQYDLQGKEHVISYASRALSDREKAYSATEKEALVAVFATDHFRPYLLGKKLTLVTDHRALCWLHSVQPKGRLARLLMDLQEYSFDVKHRPGLANGNADALSRLPSRMADNNETLWHSWEALHLVNGLLVKEINTTNGSLSEYVFVIPVKLVDYQVTWGL